MRVLKIFLLFAFLAMAGCASTTGSYRISTPSADINNSKYSNLLVNVTCKGDVPLEAGDLARLRKLIVKSVPEECSNRFTCIDKSNAGPNTLKAGVNITTYDEGNAFARAMLAGLGQMHIRADVVLTDYSTGNQVMTSEVSKTFAWGGMYGGFTTIKELEPGFARAVAASFNGKQK
jgi:hypothetical protein